MRQQRKYDHRPPSDLLVTLPVRPAHHAEPHDIFARDAGAIALTKPAAGSTMLTN